MAASGLLISLSAGSSSVGRVRNSSGWHVRQLNVGVLSLRREELNALRWSEFDGKAITISKNRVVAFNQDIELNTTKGGKNGQRRVPLDPEAIALLRDHRKRQLHERLALGEAWQDTGYIFTREDGLPIYANTISDVFKKLTRKAGLRPIRLHDLRHLHATELLHKRVPLHQVADRLGHRDAMVTATIYAHVSSEDADELALVFAEASEAR